MKVVKSAAGVAVLLVLVLVALPLMSSCVLPTSPDAEETSPPVLNLPANGTVLSSLTPRLEWYESIGAISYGVQVSTTPDFAELVIDETGIGTLYYDIPDAFDWATAYYWRANAANSAGTSDWSEVWVFMTP